MLLRACFFCLSGTSCHVTYLASNRHLLSKTVKKSADMKSKSLQRTGGRKQDDDGIDDDGTCEPADSIIDSDSEGEEDNEVDGMLG
jgi:hypothetical protein